MTRLTLLRNYFGLCKCSWAFLAFLALPAIAQEAPSQVNAAQANKAPPPRVVVVLSGGGAKGFAHLAVLRRLEQDRIPIAKIIGTSMGAVIGGLYAKGLSLASIEKIVQDIDPSRIALDLLPRSDLPISQRTYQEKYPLNFEFGLKNGKITFPRGVSTGQNFLSLMQAVLFDGNDTHNFDHLQTPFRAVATRLRDGEKVVFNSGSLALAIRASMAIPSLFSAAEIDGEMYIDGGLSANLPVDVALDEGGADIIVASYLGRRKLGTKTPDDDLFYAARRTIDILVGQNERRSLLALRPQDILVSPILEDFAITDFDHYQEIMQIGKAAVAEREADFQKLAEKMAAFPSLANLSTTPDNEQPVVSFSEVKVLNAKGVDPEYIIRYLNVPIQRPIGIQTIQNRISDLYSTGYFENIDYEIVAATPDQGQRLEVTVREKSYGPHFFKLGLGIYSDFSLERMTSFSLGYRHPWLNRHGLELGLDIQIGTQSEFTFWVHQPVGNFSVETYVAQKSNLQTYFLPVEPLPVRAAIASFSDKRAGVDLAYYWNKQITLKVGALYRDYSAKLNTWNHLYLGLAEGVTKFEPLSSTKPGLRGMLSYDSLDSVTFPTEGSLVSLELVKFYQGNFLRYQNALSRWAWHLGNHVINLGGKYAQETTSFVGYRPTSLYLGGFQSMGGFSFAQLSGTKLIHGYATYMYRLATGGILKQPTYIGTVAEFGDAWYHKAPGATFKAKYSGTFFIGIDSKIGDIYLGAAFGRAPAVNKNSYNFFLQIGRQFDK